jgi:hypothetical protein
MTNDLTPTPAETREPVAHQFETSVEAYDRSQCDETISDGDVLIVTRENRAAVLVSAWPVIVIGPAHDPRGPAFHELDDGVDWLSFEGGRYVEAAAYAVDLMDGPRGSMTEATAARLFTAASAARRARLGIGVGTKTPTADRPGSMTAGDLAEYLTGMIHPNPDDDRLVGLAGLRSAATYAEAGMMTADAGLVVTLDDGSSFQITVVRSR